MGRFGVAMLAFSLSSCFIFVSEEPATVCEKQPTEPAIRPICIEPIRCYKDERFVKLHKDSEDLLRAKQEVWQTLAAKLVEAGEPEIRKTIDKLTGQIVAKLTEKVKPQ